MTARNPLRRNGAQELDAAPPVLLPHVVITVTDNLTDTGTGTGVLDVTVDGQPFPPPPAGAWTRTDFGAVLDAITKDRTVPVRVEVRESDGSVFTDILRARTPAPPQTPDPRETSEASEGTGPQTRRGRRAHVRQAPVLVEVTGEGFVPGEDVAVAVIVSHTDATGTGHARALLETSQLGQTNEVVLYGRISGTTIIRRLTDAGLP